MAALKELARVLRIGGRLMVSVWAMEQRHRKVCGAYFQRVKLKKNNHEESKLQST